MDVKANLVEWMELLTDMLQFLDATASAKMCNSPRKAIAINGRGRHPQCAAAASTTADMVKSDDICDWIPQDRTESAEYMNIVNKIDESHRLTLIHKCNAVLGKLHEWLLASMLESPSLEPLKKGLDGAEDGEEEENSYLEMNRVGHKNDINLTQPTDKIDSCENFDKDEAASSFREEDLSNKNEEELNLEENCYDFTTDRSLYDDCSPDIKLNNVACVIPIDDDDSKCPFSGLPAAHLRIKQSPMFGTLFRQEKRLFFDQTKKFYVGLLDRWLLIYNNCNELKPVQCIQVKDLKLDLNLNDQFNEKHQFNIITQNDSKICFLSPSFKELNEWIVALEQCLLGKSESSIAINSSRKLPLPPTPDDEPDNSCLTGDGLADHTDSIYEEPQLLHKQHEFVEQNQQHNYDTPKPPVVDVCHHKHQSQQHTETGPTKITNDGLISPTTTPRANKCEPISHTVVPTVATNTSVSAPTSTPTTPTSTTPVKSWLFNRFHKSAPSDGNGTSSSEQSKHTRKALSSKKQLAFQHEHIPDVASKPPSGISAKATTNSGSNSTSTSPSSTVPSAAGKGTKINMIISQLEANGQLSLLSKSLNDPNKRNTWCLDE
ncbi:uncharacterized protein LOC134219488 [Armigeres subalbatus]|uniref:uncharacterized protein LOC134219488 n=1 Tax=Armigeres subalbatus TaxID=124917 RepID=UPI002ED4671C